MIAENNKKNTRSSSPGQKLDISRIPPQAQDMEKIVLGAILRESSAIHRVIDVIKPDSFFKPGHELIYLAALALFKAEKPVDIATVWEELKRKVDDCRQYGVDLPYLTTLTSQVANTAKLEQYTRFIEEKAIARREIGIRMGAISELYEGERDVIEILNDADTKSFEARNSLNAFKNVSPEHSANELLSHVEEAMLKDGQVGLDTGIYPLNSLTGGWQPGHLIMIGARTRHGKSAVASFFQYSHAKAGVPTVYYSMEMPKRELWARVCAIRIREMNEYIPYEDIYLGNLNAQQHKIFKDANEYCSKLPIIIDDTPNLSFMQLKAKHLKYRNDFGIRGGYLDYIQLANVGQTGKENRAQRVSDYMTDMKGLAMDLNMPMVAMSQVDREVEKRPGGGSRPKLADLKDSGGLEEKSDVVLLLYRPDAIATEEAPVMEGDEGMIYFDIAKRKMGKTGILKIPFDVATNYYEDPSRPNSRQATGNAFSALSPNSNFIIRPSGSTDDDEPF